MELLSYMIINNNYYSKDIIVKHLIRTDSLENVNINKTNIWSCPDRRMFNLSCMHIFTHSGGKVSDEENQVITGRSSRSCCAYRFRNVQHYCGG